MKALEDMTLEELWQLFPIQLSVHHTQWSTWFLEEALALCSFLPLDEVIHIAHIGSTAIANIQAKPIIDILVEIRTWDMHERFKTLLLKHGYLCMSEDATRLSFNKGYTPNGFAQRVFHLHLRQKGDHAELYFRDYVKEHEEVAKAYEQLKQQLCKQYKYHRDAYTQGKTAFIKQVNTLAYKAYNNRYETDRWQISLQEQTAAHVPIFFHHCQDEEVSKGMYHLPTTIQEAMYAYHQQQRECTQYRKVIYIDDVYVGDIWCHVNSKRQVLLSCCVFAKVFWGKGIGKQAMTLFLQDVKNHLDVQTAGAYLYANNIGSMRMLEQLNFTRKKIFIEKEQRCYYYEKNL